MSVLVAIIIFLGICFKFATFNFFINMSVFAVFFGIVEWINFNHTGYTISSAFWKWKEKAPRGHVLLVAWSMTALAIFLSIHLIFEV